MHGEIIELAEAALHFLHLHHHPRQCFVALLRRAGDFQVVLHALIEQAKLRLELGRAFRLGQFVALVAQHGAHLIELRIQLGDALDDARGLGGIGNLQPAHHADQHLQLGAGLRERLLHLVGFRDLLDLINAGLLLSDLPAIRIKRLRLQQEGDAELAQAIRALHDGLLHRREIIEHDVTHITRRKNLATQLAQRGEVLHEAEDVIRIRAAGFVQRLGRLAAQRLGLILRRLPHAAHLLELAKRCLSRAFDLQERRLQVVGLAFVDPEVAVRDVACAP